MCSRFRHPSPIFSIIIFQNRQTFVKPNFSWIVDLTITYTMTYFSCQNSIYSLIFDHFEYYIIIVLYHHYTINRQTFVKQICSWIKDLIITYTMTYFSCQNSIYSFMFDLFEYYSIIMLYYYYTINRQNHFFDVYADI